MDPEDGPEHQGPGRRKVLWAPFVQMFRGFSLGVWFPLDWGVWFPLRVEQLKVVAFCRVSHNVFFLVGVSLLEDVSHNQTWVETR